MSEEVLYRWQLLRTGPLWLDGGSMFGVVPRALWSKVAKPDDQNRILLAHNCLLLQRVDYGSPKHIVIEAGSGNKSDAKMKQIFGLSDDSVGKSVTEAGVACEDIEAVVVTHLHFDHAGGLTRLTRDGERPDWTNDGYPSIKLTFPNAPIFVQRREWDDAQNGHYVMTRTYLRENLLPLESRLRLVESPAPFPVDVVPPRQQVPAAPQAQLQMPILPGIFVFQVPGHTWGQQAVGFKDDRGRTVVFLPDIIPTINHVGAAYNMAYDVEPYLSTVVRHWILRTAAELDWLLVLDHEPGNPVVRVRPDGKGWFNLVADSAGESE